MKTTKIQYEHDEERLLMTIGKLQLSFYYEDGRIAQNSALRIIETIKDFFNFEGMKLLENPFYLQYNGASHSEIMISLDETGSISIQYSGLSVDYFEDGLSKKDLIEMKKNLEKFLSK